MLEHALVLGAASVGHVPLSHASGQTWRDPVSYEHTPGIGKHSPQHPLRQPCAMSLSERQWV